jgi:hypothetical protein
MRTSASRVGLTPSPTCHPGQGGSRKGMRPFGNETGRVNVSPPWETDGGFFMSEAAKPTEATYADLYSAHGRVEPNEECPGKPGLERGAFTFVAPAAGENAQRQRSSGNPDSVSVVARSFYRGRTVPTRPLPDRHASPKRDDRTVQRVGACPRNEAKVGKQRVEKWLQQQRPELNEDAEEY